MNEIKKKYKRVGEILTRQLKEELEIQGHVATGKLKRSIRFELQRNGKQMVIKALPRWQAVNDGQPAGTKVSGLKIKRWLTSKGIDYKKDRSIIYRVMTSIRKEGTPTRIVNLPDKKSAFGYTKNGRRTGFVDQVFKRNKIRIGREMKTGVRLEFEDAIRRAIRKVVSTSKNLKLK